MICLVSITSSIRVSLGAHRHIGVSLNVKAVFSIEAFLNLIGDEKG